MDARLKAIKSKKKYSPADMALNMEMVWSPISLTTRSSTYATYNQALQDTGEDRLDQLDKLGIDIQVLSLVSPGVQELNASEAITLARNINDELSKAVKRHPDRLVGLATIAPQAPDEAARELERAVITLGFRGVCINSHTGGEYLDDQKYWPIFAAAEKLDIPIYLHPRTPVPAMLEPYLKYPSLASAMLGFTNETNLHVMRLLLSGVFDRYPRLKIILGHLGEALPYLLWRLDDQWQKGSASTKHLGKIPSQYFKDNFIITTSGLFSYPALLCAYMQLGADNIMFAIDYPFASNEDGVRFIKSLALSNKDKEKICHLNAERIFKL
jgi:5-carboxyvanillate decarboxylase